MLPTATAPDPQGLAQAVNDAVMGPWLGAAFLVLGILRFLFGSGVLS